MRKLLCVMLMLCLLTGCSRQNEVESLAYAILFGIDLDEDGLRVSAQIPRISGEVSQEEPLTYSAVGSGFSDALNELNWVVPRKLDLSQVKLVVISEALARGDRFAEVADDIMNTTRFYTAARLAVCEGDALSFLESEELRLGSQMAADLTAMFEDYARQGFIPDVQFADGYYKSVSIYSDPLAIYVRTEQSAAALTAPDAVRDDGLPHANRFLGAAAFRGGKMVGTLDTRQLLCCKLLRGKRQTFSVSCDGGAARLSGFGSPQIRIDTNADPMRIDVTLRLSVLPGSERVSESEITRLMEDELSKTIADCQAMGIEPFQFAEIAARSFATIDDWLRFDWRSRFVSSAVSVHVRLLREDL